MHCVACGAYYGPGQRFCTGCGRDLIAHTSTALVTEPPVGSELSGGWETVPVPAGRAGDDAGQRVSSSAPFPEYFERSGRSRQGRRSGLSSIGAGALGLLALASKAKGLLLLLKFGKFGATLITMLVSIWLYTQFFGASFALGFVLLLLVHELGHWVVIRAKGLPAAAPVFIPFLGAVIAMRGMPHSAKDEAEIGLGGPIAGTAAALLTGIAGQLFPTGSHAQQLLFALAYVGLFLNLFNLIPVSPLDGGRVMAAVSRWAWPIGLVLLLMFTLSHFSGILLLILVLGSFETYRRFSRRDEHPDYYAVAPLERVMLTVTFFALVGVTFGGMSLFHDQLLAIAGGTI